MDRVAVDAAGVALLKLLGSNEKIMGKKIFEKEKIARAMELGPEASFPAEIDLIPADEQSRSYRDHVAEILKKG